MAIHPKAGRFFGEFQAALVIWLLSRWAHFTTKGGLALNLSLVAALLVLSLKGGGQLDGRKRLIAVFAAIGATVLGVLPLSRKTPLIFIGGTHALPLIDILSLAFLIVLLFLALLGQNRISPAEIAVFSLDFASAIFFFIFPVTGASPNFPETSLAQYFFASLGTFSKVAVSYLLAKSVLSSKPPWQFPSQELLKASLALVAFIHSLSYNLRVGADYEFLALARSASMEPPACFPEFWKGSMSTMGSLTANFISVSRAIGAPGELAVFIAFSALSVCTLFALINLARRLFGKEIALVLGSLAVLSSLFPFGMMKMKDYSFECLFICLSVLFALRVSKNSRKGGPLAFSGEAALLGLIAGMGVYAKIFFLLVIPALAISGVVFRRGIFSKTVILSAIPFLILGSFPYLAYQAENSQNGLGRSPIGRLLSQVAGGKERNGYYIYDVGGNLLIRAEQFSRVLISGGFPLGIDPYAKKNPSGTLWIFAVFLSASIISMASMKAGPERDERGFALLTLFLILAFSSFSYSRLSQSNILIFGSIALLPLGILLEHSRLGASAAVPIFALVAIASAILVNSEGASLVTDAQAFPGISKQALLGALAQANATEFRTPLCYVGHALSYYGDFPVRVSRNMSDYSEGGSFLLVIPSENEGSSEIIGFYPETAVLGEEEFLEYSNLSRSRISLEVATEIRRLRFFKITPA